MNPLGRILVCAALLPAVCAAAKVDDENAKLRAQVEQLKAELQAAQNSCAAAAHAPGAAVAARPAPAKPALILPSGAPLPGPAAQAAPAADSAVKTDVPDGYKLVKIEPVIPPDNRWNDVKAWESLFKGMAKDEVENLLGVDHSVTEGNNRTFWGYGKIGVTYAGKVIFVDNRLAVWTKPDF